MKKLQKTNQTKFMIEKVINKKGNKLYAKWNHYDNSFNSWIEKNIYSIDIYYMKSVNIFVNLVVVTKADLKGTTGVDTSNVPWKSDLANLEAQVDKIDTDKLKTVPADLSKLNYVVDTVKKISYEVNANSSKKNSIDTKGY